MAVDRRRRPRSGRREGYGRAHIAQRRMLAPFVEAGCTRCARCGELIKRGEPWDLGHDPVDRLRYWGPEHRACNRATAAQVLERKVSREWL